ncbi:GNAT superfamily N-acetyltransferase [Nitrobacteraceae bacterium AZCC 2146]
MQEMHPAIVVPEQPDETHRDVVWKALVAFNDKAVGPSGFQPLAILITDPATGKPAGGLWGKTAYNWCFVELFVIPEQFRGRDLGSKVLAQAEDIARERGCIGLWLDTYWFQAPEFYKKQGYEIMASLPDYPRGGPRYFLKKSLV